MEEISKTVTPRPASAGRPVGQVFSELTSPKANEACFLGRATHAEE
jgi:hypothetical protein